MTLRISGKNMDIGDALRTHVQDRVEAALAKYFDGAVSGHVTFQPEGSGYRSECVLHLATGVTLESIGAAQEAYLAFDQTATRIEKRLRRHKAEYVEQAEALLEMVGLKGFGDKFPWQLSGGMQQRANLCRALIHKPDLLMLDEPFGALDAFTREELWQVIRDLHAAQGVTIVLVTHDLREAVYLADRVFVMSARPGRITREHEITFARPRPLELMYERDFTEKVHELRGEIADARQAA